MTSSAPLARWKRAVPGLDLTATVLVLTCLVMLLLLAAAGSFRNTLLHFLPDDCFYYLEIARRIRLGQGSTFDGINPTNGYHPLWLVLLLPLAPLMNLSREAGARIVMALGVTMLGAALFILRAVATRITTPGVPTAAGEGWLALLLPGSVLTFATLYGLESPITALVFALLLWTIASKENSLTGKGAVTIGLLSGALVLSRLDSLVYVIALDLIWAWRLRRPANGEAFGSWRSWLICFVIQAVIVCGYLAFSLWKFGHLLTISAVLKAERVHAFNLLWARSLLALVAIAGIAMALIVARLKPRVEMGLVWWIAFAGSLLNLLVIAAGGGSETYSWYFTLPVLCSGLFATALVARLKVRGWPPLVINGLGLGICLLLLTVSVAGRLATPQFATRFDRAKWIEAHAPADAIFAAGNCGILGYFSRRSFVDLDGLSNSFAYEQAIRDDRVASWLTNTGFNAAALSTTEDLKSAPDGTIRRSILVRGSVDRQLCLTLKAWEPKVIDERYTLWRVIRIENQCP
jgi:hypothetical protein